MKTKSPGKIEQTHYEFMKSEAKKLYKSMRPEVKRTTSLAKIYKIMKHSWKEGLRVRREFRTNAERETEKV